MTPFNQFFPKLSRYVLFASVFLIATTVSGQATRTPTIQQQPLNYVKRMEASDRQIHWGRTYFQSYHQTKEYRYLKLSFNYCTDAVKSYFATQKRIFKTNKFSFTVKNKRLDACQFCMTISKTSSHLSTKQYLKPIVDKYCTDDIY